MAIDNLDICNYWEQFKQHVVLTDSIKDQYPFLVCQATSHRGNFERQIWFKENNVMVKLAPWGSILVPLNLFFEFRVFDHIRLIDYRFAYSRDALLFKLTFG
jgi:hypothetical protein